jgi:hypothetical protein
MNFQSLRTWSEGGGSGGDTSFLKVKNTWEKI